ncbi:hypothetical protein [Mesorhizobium sp. B2-3-10]|uniref:hypothetical protein n=1 Tax=Mesorhizobium sp. B2-3-10 TaxID=2589954 RepID=UPI0011299061|nr:hypothetical protein [Mesorhizobium sp. B2-3-10]TPL98321.1 hypothetical protein FJ943_15565 [Mesorhizobium sp. B2-3-10]
MVATRPGIFEGGLLTLFPRQLANSSLSPTLLNSSQNARQLLNILPNKKKAGSGSLRFGMGKKGPAAPADTLDGWQFRRADGTIETLHLGDDFTLRRFDESLNTYATVKSGLSSSGLLGATQFNGKLIFYNGVDPNFAYDGTTVTDLGEYVQDLQASTYTWVANNSISLVPAPGRTDYPVGRKVRVTFAVAGVVVGTITSSTLVGTVRTLVVSGTPFPGSSQAISSVEYFNTPPPFSFMWTANDILWALSGGVSKPRVYRGSEGMKVFYTSAANNENAWFDQGTVDSTQEVAFLNIQNKAGVFDELLAISDFNGAMVFHGRLKTYLYQGYDPSQIGGFIPLKTLEIGLVHQKLVQKMPNDVAFVSPYGLRTLSVQVQTDGVEVTADIGSNQDSEFGRKIAALMVDDTSYRLARSFNYPRDGLFGYKLDDDNLMVYVLNDKAKGWTQFAGYFADANAFIPLGDGRLMIMCADQAYCYANGTDPLVGEDYSDDGNAINALWWVPWQSRGGRWGNRAWEILLEDTANITFNLDRMVDFNEQNVVTTQVVAAGGGSQWDEAQWDEDGWGAGTMNPVVSDKFLADKAFSVRISFSATSGPINLLGFRPIGR